jgi:hypothetical protein
MQYVYQQFPGREKRESSFQVCSPLPEEKNMKGKVMVK